MTHYSLEWLKNEIASGRQLKYIFFWGHTPKTGEAIGKFIFSQWYPSLFIVDGVQYQTAEHWMMAKKAQLFNDGYAFERIIASIKPGEVKQIGREIKGFNESIWQQERYRIVKEGNYYKFLQHADFAKYLIDTGDRVIVEASPVDNIWGIGMAEDNAQIQNPSAWRGLNLLGFALMEVRYALKQLKSV